VYVELFMTTPSGLSICQTVYLRGRSKMSVVCQRAVTIPSGPSATGLTPRSSLRRSSPPCGSRLTLQKCPRGITRQSGKPIPGMR